MRQLIRVFSIRRLIIGIIAMFCVIGAGGALWAAFQGTSKPAPALAAMLPQGALLTIESGDFAGLLKHWNDSKEKNAWLKSDNFSVFSNSRLFGRLGGAQEEFAQAAGLPPDMSFLSEVAGARSIFAWYDIGNLEFLYITQLPAGAAEKTRLMQMRGKFAMRQTGGQTFYVRTQTGETGGQRRTVAFATSGDWLLLATREDLMAGALTLMGNTSGSASAIDSLAGEAWFADARAAAAHEPGALRMTLNLEKIVPSPYFRSYWVQRNITEMKRYRSAVADLYLATDQFREERVLLPKSPPQEDTLTVADAARPRLESLTTLLPEHAGVYRANAAPSMDAALTSLNEKLIERGMGAYHDASMAPEADVSVHPAGSAADLETRIDWSDAASLARRPKGSELWGLRRVLEDSGLDAMMTVSRTGDAALWIPFQSAIVLSSSKDWDEVALQSALREAMQAHLTAGGLGVDWKPVHSKQGSYATTGSVRPLEVAVNGRICIVANDPGLLLEMLGHVTGTPVGSKAANTANSKSDLGLEAKQVTMLAGFQLPQERGSFARWTAVVDRSQSGAQNPDGSPGEPAFFSQNVRSLSDVFSSLESEHFMERRDGALIRQTVIYRWRR